MIPRRARPVTRRFTAVRWRRALERPTSVGCRSPWRRPCHGNVRPCVFPEGIVSDRLALARELGSAGNWLAVVATTRPDGSVHASLVNAGVLDDPVSATPVIGVVVAGNARKLGLLRSSGRAAVTFHTGWRWVTVEGSVRIAGPDDPLEGVPAVQVPELLRAVFRSAGGTHDNWDEFDRVMAAERRAAVLVSPERVLANR